ncbi:hypothetical protein RBA41_25235 [Massilia sp. CCM 9210]|uniref:hypothetical protein n=1 Tax=Massilia scottii TaxID=3057166 RepID=UPI002796DB9A|nr:hypothetical protein [Massilia sp. CCM 9210]MDQ1816609.1 hypothetical protein [Massilia sp. CCM 9210]
MRKKGAGQTCHAFACPEFAGQETGLRAALAEVAGRMREVVLYSREAQAAFVEEHDGHQFILSVK